MSASVPTVSAVSRHNWRKFAATQYLKWGFSMSTVRPRPDFLRSFKKIADATRLQAESQGICPRCGAAFTYVELSFQKFGTDAACNVRLPLCNCEKPKAERLSPEKQAARKVN